MPPAPASTPHKPLPRLSRQRGWLRWLPGLQTLRDYRLAWLPKDIAAGLVLTTMLVPVGIAYAEASGVPGIYGLYATIVPLLAYALFGPSRILVLGPDSALAALILAVVLPLSGGDPMRAVTLASMMAVVAGLTCLIAGLLRLGFITELLSKPIRYGYMNGIALSVLISQTPKLFGFSIDSQGSLSDIQAIVSALSEGQVHLYSLLVGVGTLTLILLLSRFRQLPGILIAVTLATLAVALFDLDSQGVQVLGELPQGLPSFTLPCLSGVDLASVVLGGIAVALVAFADTSVLSRTYAARTGHPVDPNQELVALGAANLAGGLFQGFPISSSASRTPVAEAAGAKTQIAGVVGALSVALLLVVAPNLMQYLPTSALAAVVIAAVIGLFVITDLHRIFRVQQWEFWLSMACFAGVVTFGVIPGIGIAVVLAVIEFLWDGWRPYYTVLGQVEGIRGYHGIKRHPDARQIPGLLLFRWDAPLFFANAELFQQCLLQALESAPAPVRRVVIAAEPVTSIDVTSADMLGELERMLAEAGIELHFAEVKGPLKDKLRRFGLLHDGQARHLQPTVGAAVDAYLNDHGGEAMPGHARHAD
ncbi:SulP family inorganic anion transporter [Ectopseudomonas guguanensis]|uniref:SulP family inorganic anion transporter n=1 Tax=Ectopseudomonas guguanensis TaxID=1198456 RepID=UPI0028A9FA64|nr:sulfate permease [Pseudomonas guguanensis]